MVTGLGIGMETLWDALALTYACEQEFCLLGTDEASSQGKKSGQGLGNVAQ